MTFIPYAESKFAEAEAAGPGMCLLKFPASTLSSSKCPRCGHLVGDHAATSPIGYEAWCPSCETVFNPHGPEDLEHYECGTTGTLTGEWSA